MKKRIGILIICVCGLLAVTKAQDPVYTQAYLAPVNLNPASTGTGENDLRVSGIFRREWWKVQSSFNYQAFSIDKFFPRISSGIGFLATRSSEGYLNKNGVYGSYSYTVCSGVPDVASNGGVPKWYWTGAMQFGVGWSRVDYSKLTFADEINIGGVIPGSISDADQPINNGRLFPDFAAGTSFNMNLASINSRLVIGASAHHINRPDESLISTADTFRSQIPIRWSGNFMFIASSDESQTWTTSIEGFFYKQADNVTLQLGLDITYKYNVSLGLWVRGNGKFSQDITTFGATLSFNLLGIRDKDRLRVGVGHDSQMGGNTYSYFAGSSEAGFLWDHSTYKSPSDDPCKPRVTSPWFCPEVRR